MGNERILWSAADFSRKFNSGKSQRYKAVENLKNAHVIFKMRASILSQKYKVVGNEPIVLPF